MVKKNNIKSKNKDKHTILFALYSQDFGLVKL